MSLFLFPWYSTNPTSGLVQWRCQLLTAAKYQVALLERKLARGTVVHPADERAIEQQLSEAIRQAHSLAHGLNPVKVVARGLESALEELAASIESSFRVRGVCDFAGSPTIPDQTTTKHLYRIAQESIHNAVRHGKSRHIRVKLKQVGGNLKLRVENDVVEFPRNARCRGGMGSSNMKARADIIGASLDIRCGKRGGTVVLCRLQRLAV
jgi:signal transduction histidine kinase